MPIKFDDLSQVVKSASGAFEDMVHVWVTPRATFRRLFAGDIPFQTSLIYAIAMFVVAAAASGVLGLNGKIEPSSALYFAVGTVVIWLAYASFMHGFVYIVGARRGIRATITAYLIVIASLQPIFVLLLAAVVSFWPNSVTYQQIGSVMLGASAGGEILASGRFLTESSADILRIVCGAIIMVYFVVAVVEAQKISLLRATLAGLLSLAFWFVAYTALTIVTYLTGLTPLFRTLQTR